MIPEVEKLSIGRAAILSPCGLYRYWWQNCWRDGQGWAVFLLLNPSTADATNDDPTSRRCSGFARLWGHRGAVIVNPFAFRATDPKALIAARATTDIVGPENRAHITKACGLVADGGRLICGWGANGVKAGREHIKTVIGWIEAEGVKPLCLELTSAGHPKHPLYVSGAAVPFRYQLT